MIFKTKYEQAGKEIAKAAIATVKTESKKSSVDILKKVTPILGFAALLYWADRRPKDVYRVVVTYPDYPRF